MYGDTDMPYPEFCRLLTGVTYETPLGEITRIRAEENKDILKRFTPEQHNIRNEWRRSNSIVAQMSNEDKAKAELNFQQIMADTFGAQAGN